MTVKELIAELQTLEADREVWVDIDRGRNRHERAPLVEVDCQPYTRVDLVAIPEP